MKHNLSGQLPIIYLGVSVVLTLVLWLLQPAAGDGIVGAQALLFWALHVAIILPLLFGSQELLGRISLLDKIPPITMTILAGILGSAVFTPFAIGLDALFSAPNDADETGPVWSLYLSEFSSFVFPVSLVWLLLNARALSQLSLPRFSESQAEEAETSSDLSDAEREFWSRMPISLGRDVIAVTAELHYLRVYTPRGNTLILFAFGRALVVLERFKGMQVHRSHWVAISHIEDLVRNGNNLRCKMDNDVVLPVSRKNVKDLKDQLAEFQLKSISVENPS